MPGTRVEARPRFNIRSRPRAISQKAAEKIAPRDRRKHDERIKPALLAYCDAPAPRRVPHPGRLAVAPYHPRRCSPGANAVSHTPCALPAPTRCGCVRPLFAPVSQRASGIVADTRRHPPRRQRSPTDCACLAACVRHRRRRSTPPSHPRTRRGAGGGCRASP